MNRRSFFGKALGALSLVAVPKAILAQPVSATDDLIARLRRHETIFREDIVLDKPLVIDFPTVSKIAYCHIDARAIKHDAVITISHDKASLEFLENFIHADTSSYVIKVVKSDALLLTGNYIRNL